MWQQPLLRSSVILSFKNHFLLLWWWFTVHLCSTHAFISQFYTCNGGLCFISHIHQGVLGQKKVEDPLCWRLKIREKCLCPVSYVLHFVPNHENRKWECLRLIILQREYKCVLSILLTTNIFNISKLFSSRHMNLSLIIFTVINTSTCI